MIQTITDERALAQEVAMVIRRAAKIPNSVVIEPDSRLVEDLGVDSLDLVGVILQVQDHFDVVIEEGAVTNLCCVRDLTAYLVEVRSL